MKKKSREIAENDEFVEDLEGINITEGDKIIIKIVDEFNEIESTITDESGECSREQAIVLKSISEALNLEGFKVSLSPQGLQISWWGNKD